MKFSSAFRGFLIGLALVIFACTLASCGGSHTANKSGTLVTPAPTPTVAVPIFKVGDVVKTSIWEVKVNSVKTSQGGSFDSLKDGDIFLEISVTEKNIADQKQVASSLLSWKLRDSEGQEADMAFVSDTPKPPSGNVSSGSTIKGTLAFEVKKSETKFRLEFTPSLLSEELVTWELTV